MSHNLWMVRAGQSAIYIEEFLNNNFVGLGWNELGDYKKYKNVDEIKIALKTFYPSSNNAIGIWAWIIQRFCNEFKIGDHVYTYYPEYRVYLVGEVIDECKYDENRTLQNYRNIKWIGHVKKDDLEKTTQNTMGAISSLFLLTHVRENLEQKFNHGLDFKIQKPQIVQAATVKETFKERDLHPFLAKYLLESRDFVKLRSKTVFHEKSHRKPKGYTEWLHPDMVGVEFSFDRYSDGIGDIQKEMQVSRATLYSFELKLSLSLSNLREYYFQAVSNSSWANFGYLVVGELLEGSEIGEQLIKELIRLNNLFGIGIIHLNADNLTETKIVVPAKERSEVDWETIDMMKGINSDFDEYLMLIKDCLKINKSDQKGWDGNL